MTPTVLVVTSVHVADDTRIRERLIRTLQSEFTVMYAAREPGPTDSTDLVWTPLRGRRFRRWWGSLSILLFRKWDVAVVHDPELVPAGVLARVLRRRPVVFDVHEDLCAQIAAKDWIRKPLKGPMRGLARLLYWLAEKTLTLTLAEESYHSLFKHTHPVFPNYPRYHNWPSAGPEGDGGAVYVGDTQPGRGLKEAVEACRRAGVVLTIVGPTPSSGWEEIALDDDQSLVVRGRLSNPEALEVIAQSSVGLSPLRALPNYVDSLPTKVLEYLALGVPVVATDLPGTRRVVEESDEVRLVQPGDIAAMASAIAEAARPEVRGMAQSRIDSVRSKFRWPEDEVLDFYTRLSGR